MPQNRTGEGEEPGPEAKLKYPGHPASLYLQGVLWDLYKDEIGQRENVWRSLPFFAATLALELAAFVRLFAHLPPPGEIVRDIYLALLVIGALLTAGVLWFIHQAIRRRDFKAVSKAKELVGYVNDLVEEERRSPGNSSSASIASDYIRSELSGQIADAVDINQDLNVRREVSRAWAGRLVVLSLADVLVLAVLSFIYYIPR